MNLPSVRAENLVAVSKRLEDVGARPEARLVLAHAVRTDPLNQTALTKLIEFDIKEPESPELPENLRQLLTMRRPSPALLESAYNRLGQDRFIYVENRDRLLNEIAATLAGRRSPSSPDST